MRLIPAIDLKGGHCVRLLRGDFAAETRYAANPRELLERYRVWGADWVHLVDLDGARDGTGGNHDLIVELGSQTAVSLQVGGGLRTIESVERMLNAGVGRVVIGSAALDQPGSVQTWLGDFGAERIVLAFDVRLDSSNVPRVATHGWRDQSQISLWDAVSIYADFELKHVLCTDVSRDGALSGPNISLYTEAARRFPHVAWQASGGIRHAGDLRALDRSGAAAAISGRALLDDLVPVEDLQAFLPNASFPA